MSRDNTSPVGIGRLSVSRDPETGECVLGRPDLGVFVAVPEPGAVFVESLQAGASVDAATASASAAAGQDVDGVDFLNGLEQAGLLDAPDAADGGEASEESGATNDSRKPSTGRPRRTRQIRWIEGVSPATAARLFTKPMWAGYLAAGLVAVGILVFRPELLPRLEHLWFLEDRVLSVLVTTLTSFLLAGMHEAWHWLAGRAVGVPSIFRVSYRGIFAVFETDLTQIVTIPRRKRYGVYLAGIAFTGTVFALLLSVRLLHAEGMIALPGALDGYLSAVLVVLMVSLIWQMGAIFLRNDMYAVIANALRCHNLNRATWLTVKRLVLPHSEAERAEFNAISSHDRAVARRFALCYIPGMATVGFLLVWFIVPFLTTMASVLIENVARFEPTTVLFWESVAVIGLLLFSYGSPPLLALRERRKRKAGALL